MKLKLPTEDQIWGSQNLQTFRAQGGRPIVSDLCLGLGSWGQSSPNHINTGDTLVDKPDCGIAHIWHSSGQSNSCADDDPRNSIRPIVEGADAQAIYQAAAKKIEKINGYLMEVIEYGLYPQDVNWQYGELENRYQKGTLKQTGKTYTFNGIDVAEGYGYIPQKSPEFILNGQKYVRAIVSSFADSLWLGGCRACNGYPCWYPVKPIEWICEPNGTLVSRKALVAGIPFSVARDYVANTLSKEIEPSAPATKSHAKYRTSSTQLLFMSGRVHS